jgi:glyoxylase-like metal-dependent hydrolase (beta-lactamase superfamily II)
MKNVKRIILTHLHIDHAQAANEVRNRTGAKIYSHWIEARYLAHNLPYPGPPTTQRIQDILDKSGLSAEELTKKFGSPEVMRLQVPGSLPYASSSFKPEALLKRF